MMAEFENICGQVGSGREEIPLCGTFNISACEETSLAQGKLGDQRTVILETDSVLVVGIKASEAPRVVIPEDFCFDGADGRADGPFASDPGISADQISVRCAGAEPVRCGKYRAVFV